MTKNRGRDVAYLLYDKDGNLIDWDISDEFMEFIHSELGFENTTKRQVMEILVKHRREAEMVSENGEIVRPANATIN